MSGMTLGEYAKTLDEHALSLAEMDDYEGAKLAIEVAEAFERRQQQLDAKDFAAMDDSEPAINRRAAEFLERLEKIATACRIAETNATPQSAVKLLAAEVLDLAEPAW